MHTVFGEVVEGQDVVNKIEQNDLMNSIEILRIGEDSIKWNALDVFNEFKNKKGKVLIEIPLTVGVAGLGAAIYVLGASYG